MLIRDLIEHLNGLNPNLDVVISTDSRADPVYGIALVHQETAHVARIIIEPKHPKHPIQ